MRDEYDFSKSIRNPYLPKLGKQVVLSLDEGVVDYFRAVSTEMGISYQSAIALYLKDCVRSGRKVSVE